MPLTNNNNQISTIDSESFAQLDLNLLRLFLVVYHTNHLTQAADQLHISQSAVSHALNRLRQQLNDTLFYREHGKLYATPYAKRIYPAIAQAFDHIQQALTPITALSDDELMHMARQTLTQLTIAMHDEVELIVFDRIVAMLSVQLPHCRIISSRLNRHELGQELKHGKIDFAIDVARAVDKTIYHAPLLTDNFVVARFIEQNLPLDETKYFAAEHITVSSRRLGDSIEDRLLSQAGRQRRVKLRCQHYATACQLLPQGPLLLTLPSLLAKVFIPPSANWQVSALPFSLPKIELHGYWHAEQDSDLLHRWLRKQLFTAFKS